MSFVVSDIPRNGWWPVYEQHGMYLVCVCMGRTEQAAIRTAELFNLHGWESCTVEDMEAALLDLEGRGGIDDTPPPTTRHTEHQ